MAREHEEMTSIPDQAALWWVLLRDKEVSQADKREFADWAVQAPERVEAMLRVARLHKALSRSEMRWPATATEELIREAKAAPDEVVFPMPPRRFTAPQPRRRPAASIALGMAAALLLAVCMSWFAITRPEQFQTKVGEQRSIALSDGSRVTLNTASRIEVRLRSDRRVVDLVQGEALFEVAPDVNRPFDVRAGDVIVRAVGTQFDVDRRAARTVVTVTEGRVAVAAGTHELPILAAGDRVVLASAEPPQVQHGVDVTDATAWTRRELVFRRRPLGEIAEEFNRYNVTHIEIRSPALRSREVTGRFRADDVASFIALLSGMPAVHVSDDGAGGYIVASDEPAAPRK